MRYLTTAALSLVLAAGGAALAQAQGDQTGEQGQHSHQGGGNQGGQHGSQGGGQHGQQGGAGVRTQSTVTGGQHQGGGAQAGAAQGGFHVQGGGAVQGFGPSGGAAGHRTFTQQNGGQPGAQYGGQRFAGPTGHPQGLQFHQHALRGRDQGRAYYNPGAFRPHVTVTNRFHVSNWSRPGGWYYRPWAYGMFLPWGWFLPQYYLDWGLYDLPPPPVGCEWVREGPDAVLVDVWTGEILSVYSGVFY